MSLHVERRFDRMGSILRRVRINEWPTDRIYSINFCIFFLFFSALVDAVIQFCRVAIRFAGHISWADVMWSLERPYIMCWWRLAVSVEKNIATRKYFIDQIVNSNSARIRSCWWIYSFTRKILFTNQISIFGSTHTVNEAKTNIFTSIPNQYKFDRTLISFIDWSKSNRMNIYRTSLFSTWNFLPFE